MGKLKSGGKLYLKKLSESLDITPRRLLTVYSYILFLTPLAYWAFIEFQSVYAKVTPLAMIKQNPTITLALIVSIVDFVLGYYLLLHKEDFLDRDSFKLLMVTQFIAQAMLVNIICALIAVVGLLNMGSLEYTDDRAVLQRNKFTIFSSLAGLAFSFVLLVIIKLR